MITRNTPQRILELGQTISDASVELEKTFLDLVAEADTQMAFAAQAFLREHTNSIHGVGGCPYQSAHVGLIKAAGAASNINELLARATTLRSKCTWWGSADFVPNKQQSSDIKAVCNQANQG